MFLRKFGTRRRKCNRNSTNRFGIKKNKSFEAVVPYDRLEETNYRGYSIISLFPIKLLIGKTGNNIHFFRIVTDKGKRQFVLAKSIIIWDKVFKN